MKLYVAVLVFLCLGSALFASGAKLVTKSQEEKLIKVLKRWNDVYAEGIEAKQSMQKRGMQQQQQQQQQSNVNNNNAINIHLHQLQNQVSHYNGGYGGQYQHQAQAQYGGYGGYGGQYQQQAQGQYYGRPQYGSPQAHRYSSSSSRKRRSAGQE